MTRVEKLVQQFAENVEVQTDAMHLSRLCLKAGLTFVRWQPHSSFDIGMMRPLGSFKNSPLARDTS